MIRPLCHKCGNAPRIRRNVTASGVSQFFWWCLTCECITPAGTFLKHLEVLAAAKDYNISPDSIEIIHDYSTGTRCIVCGRPGVELHHWAPQSMQAEFGIEWYRWPTNDLCREHHRQWHEIVTPGLIK